MSKYLLPFTLVLLVVFLGLGLYTQQQTPAPLITLDTSPTPPTQSIDIETLSPPSSLANASSRTTENTKKHKIVTSKADFSEQLNTRHSSNIIQRARQGKLNLIETLEGIREECPEQWSSDHCNEMTREFMLRNAPADEQNQVLQIFDQYLDYESYLKIAQPGKGLSLEEGYNATLSARDNFFSPEMRKLIFGREEARMRFKFAKHNWEQNHMSDGSPDDLLSALENIRRSSYGEFYNEFNSRTPLQVKNKEDIDFLKVMSQKASSPDQKAALQNKITVLKKQLPQS